MGWGANSVYCAAPGRPQHWDNITQPAYWARPISMLMCYLQRSLLPWLASVTRAPSTPPASLTCPQKQTHNQPEAKGNPWETELKAPPGASLQRLYAAATANPEFEQNCQLFQNRPIQNRLFAHLRQQFIRCYGCCWVSVPWISGGGCNQLPHAGHHNHNHTQQ